MIFMSSIYSLQFIKIAHIRQQERNHLQYSLYQIAMRKETSTADLAQPFQKQKIQCQYFKTRIPRLISQLETNELILCKFVVELSHFNSKVEHILIEQPYQMKMPDTKNLFEFIKNFIFETFEKNKREVDKITLMVADLKKSKFDMENYFKDNTRRIDNLLGRKMYIQNQVNAYNDSYAVLEKMMQRQALTQCRYTQNDPASILNSATMQNQSKILREKIERIKCQIKQMEQRQFLLYIQSNKSMANCLEKVRLSISQIMEYQKQQKFVTFNRQFRSSEKKKQKNKVKSISQFQNNESQDLSQCIDEARKNCLNQAAQKIDPTNLKEVLKYAFLAESKASRDSDDQNYDNSNENTAERGNNFKKVKN